MIWFRKVYARNAPICWENTLAMIPHNVQVFRCVFLKDEQWGYHETQAHSGAQAIVRNSKANAIPSEGTLIKVSTLQKQGKSFMSGILQWLLPRWIVFLGREIRARSGDSRCEKCTTLFGIQNLLRVGRDCRRASLKQNALNRNKVSVVKDFALWEMRKNLFGVRNLLEVAAILAAQRCSTIHKVQQVVRCRVPHDIGTANWPRL